jgi:hypothetical protein
VEEVQDIIERLFAAFVKIRLDDDAWLQELEPMRHWVQR